MSKELQLQSPLTNIGAERASLSGICKYGIDAYVDLTDIIDINSYSSQSNQALFKCLSEICEEGLSIDIPTIISKAEQLGFADLLTKDKKSIEYIRSLFSFPISLENVRSHGILLAKLQIAKNSRIAHMEAYKALEKVDGSEDISKIIAISEDVVFGMIESANADKDERPQQIAQDGEELLNHLIDNPVEMIGIPTPWPIYNTLTGGGLRTGVNLIGARPGQGKSSLAKECSVHVAGKLNIPVLVIDTEMLKPDQFFRSLAGLSEVPIRAIETGQFGSNPEYKKKVFEANEKLKTMPYEHKHVGSKRFDEILSIIRRWLFKSVGFDENGNINQCLIIYDYFKLMDAGELDKMQEYQAIGFQISKLSDFCQHCDVPCLAFVQTNRQDDLSQSDRLLWLCISCFIFWEKEDEEMAEDGPENGNRKMTVKKSRFAEKLRAGDYINMNLQGNICKIQELGTRYGSLKNNDFEVENDQERIDL